MVVYADILVLVNFITDYLLLRLTSRLSQIKPAILRTVLAAVLGAFSSLYIFLPDLNFTYESIIKIVSCALICLVAFPIKNKIIFLKSTVIFIAVTLLFGGAMFSLCESFSPKGMATTYFTVYFDISPTVLIVSFAVFYFAIILVRRLIFKQTGFTKEVEIVFNYKDKNVGVSAISDSGNMLEDIMGISDVVIVDKSVIEAVFGDKKNPALKSRYRALPVSAVTGEKLLDGYRCDSAYIKCDNKTFKLEKPILAISDVPIEKGYKAIINPKVIGD